ncbi:MAG: zinc-ribbon domain-containing protein [Blastocatellia bacterium]|nr:zinc-ribbon domain-containing protein [Blastocatellia bacterium]
MTHCSNCGEGIVDEQQFCRSCGGELVVEGGRSPGTYQGLSF